MPHGFSEQPEETSEETLANWLAAAETERHSGKGERIGAGLSCIRRSPDP